MPSMLYWAAIAASASLITSACAPGPSADHHATAKKLLERIGGGIFEDSSSAEAAALRHIPSGMVCMLPPDGAFDLEVFPAEAANPGAYCSSANGEVARMIVAVRFGDSTNIDAAFGEAIASSAGAGPHTPWQGRGSEADKASPEGLPHFRVARLQANVDGAPHYLRVAVSEARGWYLQQLVTAPLEKAEAVEAKAGQEWRDLLREFVKAPKSGT